LHCFALACPTPIDWSLQNVLKSSLPSLARSAGSGPADVRGPPVAAGGRGLRRPSSGGVAP